MSLTVGTDSYISVTDADTYFSGVLYPDPWTTTDNATKEKALRLATRRIDSLMIRGVKADPEQTLEFPRALYSHSTTYQNTYLDNPLSNHSIRRLPGWVAETEVDNAVLNAVCEEALALIKNGSEANKREELQRQGVTSFSLGNLSETFSGGSTRSFKLLSSTAMQLMSKYTNGGAVIV
jgi:hypothetical protein